MPTCEHCKHWLSALKKCALTCAHGEPGDYCGSWVTKHNVRQDEDLWNPENGW